MVRKKHHYRWITLGIFFGIFVILSVAAFLTSRDNDSSQKERFFRNFDVGSVDSVEITKDSATTVLRRDGDSWFVESLNDFPADSDTVFSMLDVLYKLDSGIVASINPEKQVSLGLKPPSGIHVLVSAVDNTSLADFTVGNAGVSLGSSYISLNGSSTTYLVSHNLRAVFDMDEWRDKRIVSMAKDDISSLTIARKDSAVSLLKTFGKVESREDSSSVVWIFVGIEDHAVNQDRANEILNGLVTLYGQNFADIVFEEIADKDSSRELEVEFSDADSNMTSLRFVSVPDGTVYVRKEGTDAVFTVTKATFDVFDVGEDELAA